MASGFPTRFTVHWSVEGPLEAVFDLAHDLGDYRRRFSTIMMLALGTALAILLVKGTHLVQVVVHLILLLFYTPEAAFIDPAVLGLSLFLITTIIIFAVVIVLALFLVQAWRFVGVLNRRLTGVAGLWEESGAGDDVTAAPSQNIERRSHDEPAGAGYGYNPVQASMALVDDVTEQIPALQHQLSYAILLGLIAAAALGAELAITPMHMSALPSTLPISVIIPGLVLVVLMVVSVVDLVEVRRFLAAFSLREEIIHTIRHDPPPVIPEGPTALARFERYLLRSDRWVRTARLGKDAFTHSATLSGVMGDHQFALALEAACADGKMAVFVRTAAPATITAEYLHDYAHAVNDVLAKCERTNGERPWYARAVLLLDEDARAGSDENGSDADRTKSALLTDDEAALMDILDAEPIVLARGPGGGPLITHIQLVVDEGEMYSVVPFVPQRPVDAS